MLLLSVAFLLSPNAVAEGIRSELDTLSESSAATMTSQVQRLFDAHRGLEAKLEQQSVRIQTLEAKVEQQSVRIAEQDVRRCPRDARVAPLRGPHNPSPGSHIRAPAHLPPPHGHVVHAPREVAPCIHASPSAVCTRVTGLISTAPYTGRAWRAARGARPAGGGQPLRASHADGQGGRRCVHRARALPTRTCAQADARESTGACIREWAHATPHADVACTCDAHRRGRALSGASGVAIGVSKALQTHVFPDGASTGPDGCLYNAERLV